MRRIAISLVLSVVLGLASLTMAVARAQSAAVDGQITICSGYGVVSVSVDANGNPVGPVHPCPDCLAHLLLATLPAPQVAAEPLPRLSRLSVVEPPTRLAQYDIPPKSRGPPAISV